MKPNSIRPITICVFSHNGRILVAEGYDPVKQQVFYRPLGGAIEFGEASSTTLTREIQEELGETVTNLRYLGTLENIFIFNGQPGHEIVLVYDGAFADPAIYNRETVEGFEDDGSAFRAIWLRLTDCFNPSAPPLYPDGLLQLLANAG